MLTENVSLLLRRNALYFTSNSNRRNAWNVKIKTLFYSLLYNS
jgi:hypothetical protein